MLLYPACVLQLGTMVCEFTNTAVMTVLQLGGFDFVILDNEHGPFNSESVAHMSRYARAIGLTPIVRVPDHQYTYIAHAMDAGTATRAHTHRQQSTFAQCDHGCSLCRSRVPRFAFESDWCWWAWTVVRLLRCAMFAGAQGIMFPRILNAEQVRACVNMTLYPPQGTQRTSLAAASACVCALQLSSCLALPLYCVPQRSVLIS